MPGHDSFHLKSNQTTTYDITKSTFQVVPKLKWGPKCLKNLPFLALFGLEKQQKPYFRCYFDDIPSNYSHSPSI